MAPKNTAWKAYSGAFLECPFLRLLGPNCEPAWEAWWAFRWKLLWPLHRRILGPFTLGEVLFLPLLAAMCLFAAVTYGNVDGSAKPADFAGGLAFATAMRNSVFTLLLGLPFERALFYHKVLGVASVILGCYHGYIALCFLGGEDGDDDRRRLQTTPVATISPSQWTWSMMSHDDNFSGLLLACSMAMVCVTAFYLFRRYLFEGFHRGHIIFALACIVFAAVHGASMMALGGLAWIVDLALFYLTTLGGLHGAHSAEAIALLLPANVVRISFPRGTFKYKGGQYVFLCVKALGPQFHPFSFSSSPHEDMVHIHIRVLGNWTQNLYNLVSKLESSSGVDYAKLDIYLDGPYGAPKVDLDGDRYKSFVMVSGGIGITPMQSIWCDILEQHSRGRPLKRMLFMWSVADKFLLSSLGGEVSLAANAARGGRVLPYNQGKYEQSILHHNFLPRSFQPPMNPLENAGGIIGNRLQQDGGDVNAVEGACADASVLLGAEFYLTRVRSSEEFETAGIRPETQKHVILGQRPDFKKSLGQIAVWAQGAGERRVAVLVCGPSSMVKAVQHACQTESTDSVTFDFHCEVFEF